MKKNMFIFNVCRLENQSVVESRRVIKFSQQSKSSESATCYTISEFGIKSLLIVPPLVKVAKISALN